MILFYFGKYIKYWKKFNKKRPKICKNINNNFEYMKLQLIKYQFNQCKIFALKCRKINENAMILIEKTDGIKSFEWQYLQKNCLNIILK